MLSMTKTSSRVIPFIVIAIVVAALWYEAENPGQRIDIESYMPILVALGVGGAAKSAIQRAADAHKGITSHPNFDDWIAKYPEVKDKMIKQVEDWKKNP